MNQRAKSHASRPGTLPPAAENRAGKVNGGRPEPRRVANPASGTRSCRAAAPAPPPLLLAVHAPCRRHTLPHSPWAPPPPPHTSITARLRGPPAPTRQSSAGPGGLKPAADFAAGSSPGQRRGCEPSAPAERAAGGGGGGGENPGGARTVPPPLAGRGGRRPPPPPSRD